MNPISLLLSFPPVLGHILFRCSLDADHMHGLSPVRVFTRRLDAPSSLRSPLGLTLGSDRDWGAWGR
jgi:hypothetical protein